MFPAKLHVPNIALAIAAGSEGLSVSDTPRKADENEGIALAMPAGVESTKEDCWHHSVMLSRITRFRGVSLALNPSLPAAIAPR